MDRKRKKQSTIGIKDLNNGSKELKRVEAPLREQERDYRFILDGIQVGYSELDLAGNVIFANNTALKMSSRPKEEYIGLNYKEYMSEEMARKSYETFHEVYLTGIPKDGVVQEIIKKDGDLKIIEGSVSLIKDSGGSITGFREIWRDITERKRTEEELANHRSRLEAIFESVKDAIITVDPDLRILEVNKSAQDICGMNLKEIKGEMFSQCSDQCRRSCYEVLKQTIEKKTTIKDYRIECRHKLRHQQLVNVTSSPLLDPAGKFMGVVLVVRDLTLVRELERELIEAPV